MFLSRRVINNYIRGGYDLNFQGRTQPEGINFRENDTYVRYSNGVRSVLYIANGDYPKGKLPPFWASSMIQIDGATALRFFSPNDKVSEEVDRSISNLGHSSNRKGTDDVTDSKEVQSLLELKETAESNGKIKNVAVSYLVDADTEAQLKQKEHGLKSNLNGYKVHVSQGMMQAELDATYAPASYHPSMPQSRKPQPIDTDTLSVGFPFIHTSLLDKHGIFLGFTRTDGVVLFDMLQRDNERLSPTLLIAGQNDVGKEKLLGKYLDGLFARGHTLINIDISGALTDLTRKQGGLVIDIVDGESEYHINPLQVMPTRISDELKTDEVRSYKVHRNKMKVLASIKDASLTQTDYNNLMETMDNLYDDFDLWELNEAKQKNDYLVTTNVVETDYPLLSNLVDALDADWRRERSRGEAGRSKAESYERLLSAFRAILNDYRYMNKHSNFVNIEDEQVVTFNLSAIDDKALLHIVLYQLLSLASAESVKNGIKNMNEVVGLDDDNEVPNHVIITITGADKLFEPSYAQSLTFLAEMIDEVTKNDTGIIMEVSSLDKILSSTESNDLSPYVLATRRVFSSMRQRILTQQDVLVIPKIAKSFGDLTQSELEALRYLQYGQYFLNISGVANYTFEMQLTDRQDIDYFALPYAETARYSKMR